jgi:hypothetical protein
MAADICTDGIMELPELSLIVSCATIGGVKGNLERLLEVPNSAVRRGC